MGDRNLEVLGCDPSHAVAAQDRNVRGEQSLHTRLGRTVGHVHHEFVTHDVLEVRSGHEVLLDLGFGGEVLSKYIVGEFINVVDVLDKPE